MALSPTELQARITAIRKARDSGVLILRHGDEMTQFRSLAEMDKIIADLEAELTGRTRPRVSYVRQDSKGY